MSSPTTIAAVRLACGLAMLIGCIRVIEGLGEPTTTLAIFSMAIYMHLVARDAEGPLE